LNFLGSVILPKTEQGDNLDGNVPSYEIIPTTPLINISACITTHNLLLIEENRSKEVDYVTRKSDRRGFVLNSTVQR